MKNKPFTDEEMHRAYARHFVWCLRKVAKMQRSERIAASRALKRGDNPKVDRRMMDVLTNQVTGPGLAYVGKLADKWTPPQPLVKELDDLEYNARTKWIAHVPGRGWVDIHTMKPYKGKPMAKKSPRPPTVANAMDEEVLTIYARAFALWEKGFRKKPETFMTNEECAKMAVASLSVQRAMCFAAYVRKVQ